MKSIALVLISWRASQIGASAVGVGTPQSISLGMLMAIISYAAFLTAIYAVFMGD